MKSIWKQIFVDTWRDTPDNLPIKIKALPYDSSETMESDSLIIKGSNEFIQSILSNLKGLLEQESENTRLDIKYEPILTNDLKFIKIKEEQLRFAKYFRVTIRVIG